MKKNFIYALIACFTLSLAACSTDPEDATSKHVYGENENPYLKTNADAVVSTKAEFPISRLEAKTVKLTDYAEKFHTYLGMTVDETLAALSNGSVVFYPINISKNCWNRTAPTKGTNGWYYNTAGGVCDAASGIASIELDATKKELVLNVLETAPVGTIMSINVGFAINNGADFDDYIRFSFDVTVTDPSKIVISGTLAAGDYAGFSINFADYADAIEPCIGLSVDEFSKQVKNSGDARGDSSITLCTPLRKTGLGMKLASIQPMVLVIGLTENRMFHRMEIIVSTLLNLVKEVFLWDAMLILPQEPL